MTAVPAGPFCARARTGSLSAGRSSFPRLDPMLCSSGPPSPTSPSTPLDPAFSYLPPGLGLTIKGHSAVFLDRDDFELPDSNAPGARPAPPPTTRRASPSSHHHLNGSRKSSDSSSSSADTHATWSPPSSSSLASSIAEDPAAAARRKARTWLAAGEDPGLGAARRALWEDPEDPEDPAPAGQEEARAASEARVLVGTDEADDEAGDDDEDDFLLLLPPVPSPSRPSHATLPPLPSCLRPPLLGRSVSGSSQASSTASVQFAPEQPPSAVTYSPSDYERRGQGPVEKLSIKEWVELKSVREAVGLFSGKIEPWKDGIEPPSPTESQSDDSPYSSAFASSDANAVLSPKRSCGQLAAAAGLLVVGNLANPQRRETC